MNSFRCSDGQIAFRDRGAGTPVIFVHGTPSSSREFESVIAQLQASYRCLALDHLGFGNSDKPVDRDYTLAAHSRRFQEWLDHLGIQGFHLVVHDFGGAIALPVALAHWSNVKSLTLMNTWAWPISEVDPSAKKHQKFMTSRFMRYLYLNWNFSPAVLVKAAWGRHKPLSKEHHALYKKPFPHRNDRHALVALLSALYNDDEPAWKLAEKLRSVESRPTQIIWGEADKLISTAHRSRWNEIFPHAKVERLSDVGHFVCDEAPELAAPALKNFLDQSR